MSNVTSMPLPQARWDEDLDDDAGDLNAGVSEDEFTEDDMDTDRIAA